MDILKRLRDPEYDWCNNSKKCNGPMFMEAADEIERLRRALQHILTHCKSDAPPNAQALILFANNALGDK